ncbi:hypothetical protein SO574_21150 [Vibrio alfacsensis]|uniref:hypothetical protein n=1 Tax=Vibrio alfacsensis TaxID=1074311 RepID=UPI002ADDF057|nr:hypothetical protein [Vibrio alfacsensis]WQE78272.1 hypothetical protein SO574_21150 [Vibrio alfacsensis]
MNILTRTLLLTLSLFSSFSVFSGENDQYRLGYFDEKHQVGCGESGSIIIPSQFIACMADGSVKPNGFVYDSCQFQETRIMCSYTGTGTVGSVYFDLENPNKCADNQGTIFNDKRWDMLTFGLSIEACTDSCLFTGYGIALCATGACIGDIIATGDACDFNGGRNSVNPVPSLCKRDAGNTGYLCPYDVNENGLPDDSGQQYDPYATCGYDAVDHFACTGGSYDHDGETTPPEDPDNELPESELPDLTIPEFDPPVSDNQPPLPPTETPDEPDVETPSGQDLSGVISAITGQNRDINKNFSNLITANNSNFADLNTRLRDLNSNTAALNNNVGKQLLQDYEIYKREKEQAEIIALDLKKQIKEENQKLIDSLTVNKDEVINELTAMSFGLEKAQEDTTTAIYENNWKLSSIDTTLGEMNYYARESVKYSEWIQSDLVDAVNRLSDIKSATEATKTNANKTTQAVNKVNTSVGKTTTAVEDGFNTLGTQLETQTGAIVGALEGLSIEGDFSGLEGALTDASNSISGAASSINGVASGLDELLDKLEPCVPTVENNYCENPHGLGESYISDALNQADSVVSGSVESWAETVTSAAEDMVNTDLTVESEAHISFLKDMALSILPEPSSCQNLSLPTMMGKTVSIDCGFSEKLKMLFSILIYAFTIKALVEILLTEVVPVAGNKPSSGRYY